MRILIQEEGSDKAVWYKVNLVSRVTLTVSTYHINYSSQERFLSDNEIIENVVVRLTCCVPTSVG